MSAAGIILRLNWWVIHISSPTRRRTLKKLWKVGAAAAVLVSAAMVNPATAQSLLGSQGGQGSNKFSSLCLRPVDGGGWNGNQIQQVTCNTYDLSYFSKLQPIASSC